VNPQVMRTAEDHSFGFAVFEECIASEKLLIQNGDSRRSSKAFGLQPDHAPGEVRA
jgi:hypothetical protein